MSLKMAGRIVIKASEDEFHLPLAATPLISVVVVLGLDWRASPYSEQSDSRYKWEDVKKAT